MTPFDKGCQDLIKDDRLIRYLILCLPFNESVVENIIMSLLFKLQGSLYFLRMMNRSILKVLKVKDQKVAGLGLETQISKKSKQMSYTGDPKQQDNFQYFAEKMSPIMVQINFQRIKLRCLEYQRKLMKLMELVTYDKIRILRIYLKRDLIFHRLILLIHSSWCI